MKKVSDLSAKLGSASSDLSARIASLPTLLPTPAESSASSQQWDSAGVQAYSTSIRTPSGPTARSVPPHLSVPPQASQASRPRATNASTHSDRSQTTARPQLSIAEQKDTGETIAPTTQVQPLVLDDEDNLWSLVTKKKPMGKKAVLYVGNLDETVTEEKLRVYPEPLWKGWHQTTRHLFVLHHPPQGGWVGKLGRPSGDRPCLERKSAQPPLLAQPCLRTSLEFSQTQPSRRPPRGGFSSQSCCREPSRRATRRCTPAK